MVEVAASCTQPVWDIGKCLWAGIARRINYSRKLSKNWEALCNKASELYIRRQDIVIEIERVNPQKTPTKECDDWRRKVAEMENNVETMKQEFNVEKRCVRGLCPDICARIELGERVVNMISDITILLDKSKFENGYLVDSLPAKVAKRPHPHSKLTPRAYEMLDRVLEKVRDNSTPKVGIWGMGGIGKTTVLQLLNDASEIAAMFNFVIWVTASKSQNIRTIQEVIGRRLLVDINTLQILSDDEVASILLEKLDGKKYMLLLDDVWETVDLAAVGLPNVNQDNGCKVVLTTRKLEVCRKMGTDIEIKMVVLSDEEAWEMFHSNVEDVARLDPIKPLAKSIARECDGLPLALKVVSSVLRKEANVSVWRNFLKELRSPATSSIEDFDENVFKILKVSYDQLKDISKKKCLLFCGLYPEDKEMSKSELIAYWRAEGILSGRLTLAEAHDKGDAILQALIDASLLENCYRYNYVKMHDVVRDLVLAMTSLRGGGEESVHLVRAGICSENMPEEVEWTKATRISFIDHDLRHLPESPDSPELLTLLLQGNDNLEMISETFFNNMPNVRVLDLSRTRIKTLPSSISKLGSLRELVLLDCSWLEALPVGAINRLSQLEVFKFTGVLSDESTEIVAKELSNLSSLSSLEFNFRRVSNLLLFLRNSKSWKEGRLTEFGFFLENYQSVSIMNISLALEKYKRCLFYDGTRGDDRGSGLPSAIEDVLNQSNCFVLQGHERLSTLSEVGVHNTRELRYFRIERCVVLEQIIDRKGLEMGAFSNLEILWLAELLNLKSIVSLEMEAPPPNVNTFTNLTTLVLHDCPRIEQVFSNGFIVQQLSNLERLWITSCLGLKGMIPDDQKVKYEALPKLRDLSLMNLPEFVSFFNGVPMCWQSLDTMLIWDCAKLRVLPFDTNSAPNLKVIKGDPEWQHALVRNKNNNAI